MAELKRDGFSEFLTELHRMIYSNLAARTQLGSGPDWLLAEVSSVINSHLSRQTNLARTMAENPNLWTGHVAPLILRSMIDCLISLRWILKDPTPRSQEFIQYGLGQAKLGVHHLQEKFEKTPNDEVIPRMIEMKAEWINSQFWHPFIDVNLGSWSGKSTRQMAKEAEDEDLYNFSFTPFSACVHNTWEHISVWDAVECANALHKRHLVPSYLDMGLEPDFLFHAAKYLTLTFDSFDEATGFISEEPRIMETFWDMFEKAISAD